MKKIFLSASVLAIAFTACKKENTSNPTTPTDPGSSSKLLKKITETQNGQATVYNFSYDAAKRLTSVKTTDNTESIDFTYDANGNVTKMEQREDNNFRNVYAYTYNNGVPVLATLKSWELTAGEPDALYEDDVLTYTLANNLVTKINVNMKMLDKSVDFELSYASNNLSKIVATGTQGFDYSASFTYGDKKPVYPRVFNYVMDPSGYAVQFFAKNDIRKVVFDLPGTTGDKSITTTYTYDAAGYPLTATDGSTTSKFDYE